MREKRLLPYLAAGNLSLSDLVNLLTSAEECGNQHIFLYTCSPADAIHMMDRARTVATMNRQNLGHLLAGPDVQAMPATPTIVDVRWETAAVDLSMTIKEVAVHTKPKLLRERTRSNMIFKVYENVAVRGVNVAKLHRSGLFEIRLQRRDNTTKYDGDLVRFVRQINEYFPFARFTETSLTKAKDTLWAQRGALVDLIRYTDASMIDEAGNTVRAATGSDKHDLSQSAAGKSIDYLLDEDKNAYCAESNLWFVKSDHLGSPIHVLLNGDGNEFALTAKCSAGDYEYVLNQIRHFNR